MRKHLKKECRKTVIFALQYGDFTFRRHASECMMHEITSGVVMEESAQKCTWGITAKAVIAFSVIMLCGYMLGGF